MDLVAEADRTLLEDLKQKGMQVTTPDQEEFRKAAEPVYELFYQKYGDKAKKLVEDIKKSK